MPPRRKPAQAGSGSPPSGEPVYLAIGLLRRPHGLHGEILMEIYTDFPERLEPGTILYIGDNHRPLRLLNVRGHHRGLLVHFEGVNLPEQAGEFRGQLAYVPVADRPPLPEGEYYHHQLIGLRVVTDDGRLLGILTGILQTGANDVYAIVDDLGREVLLPAIPQVVLDVDLERGEMQVHLLAGLVDGS
jgi:16S rRNA processing protein RimM